MSRMRAFQAVMAGLGVGLGVVLAVPTTASATGAPKITGKAATTNAAATGATSKAQDEVRPAVKDVQLTGTERFVEVPSKVSLVDGSRQALGDATITTSVTRRPATTGLSGERERLASFLTGVAEVRDGIMFVGDDVVVSVPSGLAVAKGETCTRLGDRILVKTGSGRVMGAFVGDVFDSEADGATDVSDESSRGVVFGTGASRGCGWGLVDESGKTCDVLRVWSNKASGAKSPLEGETVTALANVGPQSEFADFASREARRIENAAGSVQEAVRVADEMGPRRTTSRASVRLTMPATSTQEAGARAFVAAAQEELRAWEAGEADFQRYKWPFTHDGVPGGWCGMFVGYCAGQVGSTSIEWNGDCIPSDPTTPRNYKDWYDKNPDAGTVVDNGPGVRPQPGDLLLMWGGAHVEIVESVEDDGFWCIAGGGSVDHNWHDFESDADTWFITPNWERVVSPAFDVASSPVDVGNFSTAAATDDVASAVGEFAGRKGTPSTLSSGGWSYVGDVVLADGDDVSAVSAAGIRAGDVLAGGTGIDVEARVCLGEGEDGNVLWATDAMTSSTWGRDLRRRSIWRRTSVADRASVAATGSTLFSGEGVQRFIESCRRESEAWASGETADDPWKYINYWKGVVPGGESVNWGGQCSEYVLWNLANIGLVPGRTMADLDKICWGARSELAFLQEHPEYGEIHALDGAEDGCIPGYYVPRPGDICVHNHGDHFEMVSEVFDDHWEGYSSGSEGCGPTWHAIDPDPSATNHDGYYVFLSIDFDRALADSV